jgi:GNAT superfamily N-acetyltransferase
MDILPATPDEAETLQRICLEAKAYWGYPEEFMRRWRALVRITPTYLQRSLAYKAVDEGVTIGWYALVQGHQKCLLDHLWVTPARIGTGVGRALFDHALVQSRLTGAKTMELEAEPRAVGFYVRMGARQVGVVLTGMDREIPVMVVDL